MGPAASAIHGDPSRQLTVVGVTGTSGKSTTTMLLSAILEADGRPTRLIGNLTSGDLGFSGDRPPNTPESPQLQAELARAVHEGVKAVVMEVTSVAASERRIDGTWFEAAVFTNLGHDHLEYHHDIESYFAAKSRLFEPSRAGVAVLNADDPFGRRLIDTVEVPVRTYSRSDAIDLRLERDGSAFRWRGTDIALGLPGAHNVSNALAAAESALALGTDPSVIAAAFASVSGPPGRFERVDEGQPFEVVVDFAHTPEALDHVLRTAAQLSGRPPVVVFGCGGDRDAAKRPLMGAVAANRARIVVLTSDNPRSEDPLRIIEEIRAGMPDPTAAVVEPDRAKAIAVGLAGAEPGDVLVIAGKGHETGQTARGATVPFDDREIARELLREMTLR
jgi:UDP-N-acetylmuramoyl-L-alanyl-D-glutamate--2,6-diaminopimelate ligase